MENEKKIWFIEQYAHKTWTISLSLMQEAARAGDYGRGYAVVAHESQILAEKLFEYAEKVRFGGDEGMFKGIVDFAIQMKFLSVNAMLETLRMVPLSMEYNIPKTMSVYVYELSKIALALNGLADRRIWQNPVAIPEIATPSGSQKYENFFFYSIGGHPMIEYDDNIQEVCYVRKSDTEGADLALRGNKVPLINCYRRFGLEYTSYDPDMQTIMVICPDSNNRPDERYAVPIDDLGINVIFHSRAGCAVPAKIEHVFADYARECWDAAGGGQFVFADWKKLAAE